MIRCVIVRCVVGWRRLRHAEEVTGNVAMTCESGSQPNHPCVRMLVFERIKDPLKVGLSPGVPSVGPAVGGPALVDPSILVDPAGRRGCDHRFAGTPPARWVRAAP